MNRTQNRPLAALTLLSAAALSACNTAPISGHQTNVPVPPQIELTKQSLADDTAFPPPVVHIIGPGQLDVSVTVQNLTNKPMVLEYQYTFFRQGVQASDYSGWMPLRISPRGDNAAQFRSYEAGVDDFRIRFRPAQLN